MLKDFSPIEAPCNEIIAKELKEEREKLFKFQQKIKESKLPVMVIFEGWDSAGKGSIIGNTIKDIDPRFFQVATMDKKASEEEQRRPFLYRFVTEIPEAGKFKFFDTCWMKEVTDDILNNKLSKEEYKKRINSINTIERHLTDNGYLVVKFFLNISKKEQKKRLKSLEKDKNTKWRVNKKDWWQNKNYEKCLEVFDDYLFDTNSNAAPWYIIESKNKKWATLQVLKYLNQNIDNTLKNDMSAMPVRQDRFEKVTMPKLCEVDLNKTIDEAEYEIKLKTLQKELSDLQNKLYRKKIPLIICYEGWDAAGKGGNIKRISSALDPRDYIVHPIASPEPHEKSRYYLWRFWNRLPKTGHVAIFDRTWYGRVMVERLEGFCSENDWQRAYTEMNEFERELVEWGAIVIKFWVQIDSDTQLSRFNERQNTPEKQWKITEEDWRNREKWDLYECAVNEMIEKTSTTYAPWHILESVDKKYARIKALEIVIKEIKKVCE